MQAQQAAADALERIGAPAVPQLINVLQAEQLDDVKQAAAQILGKIGPKAEPAVPALAALLGQGIPISQNWSGGELRDSAALALGEIGPGARNAVPALIEAFRTDRLRGGLTQSVLVKVGNDALGPISEVLQRLNSTETKTAADIRLEVFLFDVLAEIGGNDRSLLPIMRDALSDQQTCIAAAKALAAAKHEPTDVALLVKALECQDPWQNRTYYGLVIDAIGSLGGNAKEAVPALIARLGDTRGTLPETEFNHTVQRAAANALGKIGPPARAAVPDLLKFGEKDQHLFNAPVFAKAIANMGNEGLAVFFAAFRDVLAKQMAASRAGQRSEHIPIIYAEVTEEFGSSAFPYLINQLASADKYSALAALGWLAQFEDSVPLLIKTLGSKSLSQVQYAEATLMSMAKRANAELFEAILRQLMTALKNKDGNIRVGAAYVIGELGPKASGARPTLASMLGDGDPNIRNAAADALRKLNAK